MTKAIIEFKDEVNCKIHGLRVEDRRAFSSRYKKFYPYAQHIQSVKLGRWDGSINFFQLGGSTYINLLSEIVPELPKLGYELEVKDNRTAPAEFNFPKVENDSFSHVVWGEGHPHAGESIRLFDHQVSAINTYLENLQCMQCISTSAGKTIITSVLSTLIEPYGRSLIIVPSKSLVKQTEKDYLNFGLDVGVYYGDRKDYDKTHTICTWQSLSALQKDTKNGIAVVPMPEFIRGVTCVIVDECHSAKGNVLHSLLTTSLANIPIRWGLTGTIPKEEIDQMFLKVGLGESVGQITASELQELGILSNCHIHVKQLMDDITVNNYQSALKHLLSNKPRLTYISEMIKDISATGNTLVLVDRISAIQIMSEVLGDAASVVVGSTNVEERQQEYDDVNYTNNKILLCTYGVAAVGINIPRLFNIVLIEPGKSFVRVIQSIGRGLRKAKDKEYVDIYDITSNSKFAKRHLTERKKFYREAEYPHTVKRVEWK